MGTCCSKPKQSLSGVTTQYGDNYASPEEVEIIDQNGPLLVRVTQATNVPNMDLTGESDPYINMTAVDGDGKAVSKVAKWPCKQDMKHPVWNSARDLGVKISDAVSIRYELWDQDTMNKDDLIGTAEVKISDLKLRKPTPVAIQTYGKGVKSADKKKGECCVHIALEPLPPSKKTIYFIRHGESKWNKAQADKDLVGMAEQTDHPLNEAGTQQAAGLRDKVSAAIADPSQAGTPEVKDFMEAEWVVMSPLTRAVETGLIGLKPILPAITKHYPIMLCPNAREKKNLGGVDTTGTAVGPQVMERVKTSLLEFYSQEETAAMTNLPFDIDQVNVKWWNTQAESPSQVEARIDELFCQLRFCPATKIIVVGHSHYFREVFRGFQNAAIQNGAQGQDLQKKKLCNAGVACCKMDFDQGKEVIMDVKLLFGTTLVS